jgi:hypothetical protein
MHLRFLRAALLVTIVFLAGDYGYVGSAIGLLAVGALMWCFALSEFGISAGIRATGLSLNAGQMLDLFSQEFVPEDAPVYVPTSTGLELARDFTIARINGQPSIIIG